MVRNRIRETELKEFLLENEIEEEGMPQYVVNELEQAHKMTSKIDELPPSGIPMEEALHLIQESKRVKVVTKTMEEFEQEWTRAVTLSQKIKELNSGAVTLRGVQAIIKEKKNLQIQIEGASQLKAALGRAQKWFSRASGFFKRPKPRSSQTILPTSNILGEGQESISLVRSEGSSNLDELIEEAGRLELQCLDVVKTQRELVSLRKWERRVKMVLEDPKQQTRHQTLESLVEQGQQMKGQIPLLEELMRLQDRVKWEQRSEQLLQGKGTKLKKLEMLVDQGEQKHHSPALLNKLKQLHKEIIQLQDTVSEQLAQCNDRRGKANYQDLSQLLQKCQELPVNVPAKHALSRKLHELDNWVRKAKLALGGTRESAKLNQLKQLLQDWGEIRVSVKEEQHLRSLVFPTQGFIEKMKKCARKYEKQAQMLNQPKHLSELAPMTLSNLVSFQRRPCAYEECVALIEQAPEIVKQDPQYQTLLQLLQQAVEWEKDILSSFEEFPPPPDIKERLLQYRRIPAKRSVVSHVMRLNLVHEWKAKVLKLAGSAPFTVLHVLLEEGRQLWSDTTRSPIEAELKSLSEKVERLTEWMQFKKLLQNENEEGISFPQKYYAQLANEASRLGLSGACDAVSEIEFHYQRILAWKSKAHALLHSDIKVLTELEHLEEEYHELDVEIPYQEKALQGLLQLYHMWTCKARIAVSSRCAWMNEYRLRVVVEIPHYDEPKLLIIPDDEEDQINQYCICRSQECLLKMVACDRCNQWFHVQCLLSLDDADSVRLHSLQNQDFICPLCQRRSALMPGYIHPSNSLLTSKNLVELLQEADQMGLHSPETELLRHMISKIKQHKDLVEAELSRELEILPLPGLEEIKRIVSESAGESALRIQKSIQQWKERNKYLEQLYLQSLGLPVEGNEMRAKILSFLRARDWIEKFYFLNKHHESARSEKELADKYLQLLTAEGLRADVKHSKTLLSPVVKALSMIFNSSGETTRQVQEMVTNGGKASQARKLLAQVEVKGINTFYAMKLKKLLQKYEEWADKVRGINNENKVKSMAFIEQLIEDGMYLYLYEDQSDLLTTIHSVANKWLEDARAVIISSSSSSPSKLSPSGIKDLLERYEQEVAVEFKEVEKLRELRHQMS